MAIVTLLCAPRDEVFGRLVAAALERAGHEPQWPATDHDASDLALAEDAAVVIWSGASLPLLPFHRPALDALARGVLAPISIDGAPPPAGFEDLAPVDLAGWRGDDDDPRWRFVLEEIALAALRRRRDDAVVRDEAIENGLAEEAPAFEDLPLEDAEPVAPRRARRRQSRFGATAVALSGASLLAVLAVGAILVSPNLEAVVEADTVAEAVGRTTLSFVQPVNAVEDEGAAENDAPADFEITVKREAPGPIADAALLNDAAATAGAPDVAELRESPGPSAADGAVSDAQEATASVMEAEPASQAARGEEETTLPALEGEGDMDFAADGEAGARAAPVDLAATASAPDPADMERLVAEVARAEHAPGESSSDTFRDCAACPEMASIPAGRFVMGAPIGEMARQASEGPAREATIANAFALGAREVTFAQWDACLADGGCRAYKPFDHGWGRSSHPVVNISFEDAQSYVAWLSQKTGKTYRLPSETEWEYAARAGREGPFAFDGPLTAEKANYDSTYPYDGPPAPAREQTMPAGSFAPNVFGLYDMHGNVWEWTAECWREDAGGDCGRRVLKGGAWNTGGWRLRAGHRIGKEPAAREFDNGFRVARDLD